jgi:hypothetical protein
MVLDALRALREEWRERPDAQHPYLRTGTIVPTSIDAGQWIVSHPAIATLRCHVQYLPGQADGHGTGDRVVREIEERVRAAARADPWLEAHPPTFIWHGDAPPAFHGPEEPISAAMLDAMQSLGLSREIATRTTWFDAATFSRTGRQPSASDRERSRRRTRSCDIDELVRAAQVLAVAAMRFCGVDDTSGRRRGSTARDATPRDG